MESEQGCLATPRRSTRNRRVQFSSSCTVYSGIPWNSNDEQEDQQETEEPEIHIDSRTGIDNWKMNVICAILLLVVSVSMWITINRDDFSFRAISETVTKRIPRIIREYLDHAII